MSLTTAKRFTVTEYHRLVELGFFGEDERVELIKGEINLPVFTDLVLDLSKIFPG